MKNYYASKRTKSVYKLLYTTPTPSGLPVNERWVVLQCLTKYTTSEDQEFVTIPLGLLDDLFSEDVTRQED
jgi:hypothetical protein